MLASYAQEIMPRKAQLDRKSAEILDRTKTSLI